MQKLHTYLLSTFTKKRVSLLALIVAITLIGDTFWKIHDATDLAHYIALTSAAILLLLAFYYLHKENRRANKVSRELRTQKEHLKVILNSISEGLITTDNCGKIEFMNTSAERLTQWSNEEATGLPLQRIYKVVNEDTGLPFDNVVHRIIQRKKPIELENNTILYTKRNDSIMISNSGAPLMDKERNISGTVLVFNDVSKKIEAEKRISKEIIQAQEEERQYIGFELHDNVNQILAGAMISLDMANAKLDEKEKAGSLLDKARKHIDHAIVEIRKLSHELAPDIFDNSTLRQTIEELFDNINIDNQFAIQLYFDGLGSAEISGDIQRNVYRILQEQTKNILKHAMASKIEVDLTLRDNIITVRICDNGKGFETNSPLLKGIGLKNIKKRAELFNGTCIINSAIGEGCEIIVSIPI